MRNNSYDIHLSIVSSGQNYNTSEENDKTLYKITGAKVFIIFILNVAKIKVA